jgi:hypothetical protein
MEKSIMGLTNALPSSELPLPKIALKNTIRQRAACYFAP